MTTSQEITPIEIPHQKMSPLPNLLAVPPLYIKLDWGRVTFFDSRTYVVSGAYSKDSHDWMWDIRFTIYYMGVEDATNIKYIDMTLQALDRVDEPIGKPQETRFTGPLEPHDYSIYDHKCFWEGREYSSLGSIKIVKLIITYMDNTVEKITDESTIKAICIPSENIKLSLPIIKEPIKRAPPTKPPIYIHFNFEFEAARTAFECDCTMVSMDFIYIGNNEECGSGGLIPIKSIYVIYDDYIGCNWLKERVILNPKTKMTGCGRSRIDEKRIVATRKDIRCIFIIYADDTYVDFTGRMIDEMTSEENFNKADRELKELLEADEIEAEKLARKEAEFAVQKAARREECCSTIKKCAFNFIKNQNDTNAASFLNVLKEYCPNDEVMGANYLTKELVASACSIALPKIVFDMNIDVTQSHRNDAKLFLARITPHLNSEESYNEIKAAWLDNLCSMIKTCSKGFQKPPNNLTANSLLDVLNSYCSDDKAMAANYLTKELVASDCDVALQKIVFDTNINVTYAQRSDAEKFLMRFAPNLNSEESYNKIKTTWRDDLCSKINTCSKEFLKTPNNSTAQSLLTILNTYCPNDEIMVANYLTKEFAASSCSEALQKIAFDTQIDTTQATCDDAKAFLARIAPDLNSEELYNKKKAEELGRGCLVIIIFIILIVFIILTL